MPEPRTKTGKRIADGYDLYSDPGGYLIEKELARRRGKEAAERLMKTRVNPILTGADILLTPIPNPKGYKDGQSGRPSNADTAGLAYDGLQKGTCVPRALLNGAPSAAPVPSGGPAPGPSPGNFCASVDELTSYVNRYQKEFEEIARREMADWMAPRESMQSMTDMIAQIERQLQNPAIDPELRRWAQQELRSLKQAYDEAYKRGVRLPDGAGAQPVPFANDPVHRAGQRIDSELSIKPWR